MMFIICIEEIEGVVPVGVADSKEAADRAVSALRSMPFPILSGRPFARRAPLVTLDPKTLADFTEELSA